MEVKAQWLTHLVDPGAVFKRAGVVDVVHQADHVTCQVRLRQEVEIWHHLMELGEKNKQREGERAHPDGRISSCVED